MKRFFSQLYHIRWYASVTAIWLGVYIWATFTGKKLSGDDNEVKEVVGSEAKARNHFYHK